MKDSEVNTPKGAWDCWNSILKNSVEFSKYIEQNHKIAERDDRLYRGWETIECKLPTKHDPDGEYFLLEELIPSWMREKISFDKKLPLEISSLIHRVNMKNTCALFDDVESDVQMVDSSYPLLVSQMDRFSFDTTPKSEVSCLCRKVKKEQKVRKTSAKKPKIERSPSNPRRNLVKIKQESFDEYINNIDHTSMTEVADETVLRFLDC